MNFLVLIQRTKLTWRLPQWIKTMNKILQKRIEEAAKKYNARAYSPFDDPYELSKEFERDCYCFKEGANYALSNQWISVEEALPEDDRCCLVMYEDGGIVVAKYNNGSWWWQDGFVVGRNSQGDLMYSSSCKVPDGLITHWMPIHELKGGEE